MVIRYGGISLKLGSSQGECPYSCTQVSFGGEDDEGGGDEVSHSRLNRYSNLQMTLQRVMMHSSIKIFSQERNLF